MPYLTSWDINVFLCLVTWGIPEDVVKGMLKMTKKVHEEFTLKEAREYYLDREKWMPKTGPAKNRKLLGYRYNIREVYRPGGIFYMNAILPIKSITEIFFLLIENLNMEYKERLSVIDPEGKYGYYVWAYENFWYKSWNCHPSKRLRGFHPGRFFLMDLRREISWMEIRDLEENAAENAAWKEERFIRGKDQIDVLIEKNNVHRKKERVLREIISL